MIGIKIISGNQNCRRLSALVMMTAILTAGCAVKDTYQDLRRALDPVYPSKAAASPSPAGPIPTVKDQYQNLLNALIPGYGLSTAIDRVDAINAAATSSPSPTGPIVTGYNQPVIRPNGVESEGALDPTFKACTVARSSVNVVEVANAVAIQADGKIVAAGYTSSREGERGNKLFALARYDPDGRLDATFGVNGKVTTRIDRDNIANAVAIQADGKIVAGGGSFSIVRKSFDFTLVRYNINGSLDASFGEGGIATKSITTISMVGIDGIVLQTDGKIVAVGTETTPGKFGTFTLLRFNPDGTLDPTFGTNGKVSTNISATNDIANAVAVQADGKIVAVGSSVMSIRRGVDFSVVRYNTDGSLDRTFGAGGKVATDTGGQEGANAVTIQADGKIVVVGDVSEVLLEKNVARIGVMRYNTNGSVDSTFAGGGMVKTQALGEDIYGRAVAIQQNGKILVVGGPHFSLLRYTTDGHLDTSFGAGGEARVRGNSFSQSGSALAIQADGKIVAAGTCSGRESSAFIHDDNFSLVRYLP